MQLGIQYFRAFQIMPKGLFNHQPAIAVILTVQTTDDQIFDGKIIVLGTNGQVKDMIMMKRLTLFQSLFHIFKRLFLAQITFLKMQALAETLKNGFIQTAPGVFFYFFQNLIGPLFITPVSAPKAQYSHIFRQAVRCFQVIQGR